MVTNGVKRVGVTCAVGMPPRALLLHKVDHFLSVNDLRRPEFGL